VSHDSELQDLADAGGQPLTEMPEVVSAVHHLRERAAYDRVANRDHFARIEGDMQAIRAQLDATKNSLELSLKVTMETIATMQLDLRTLVVVSAERQKTEEARTKAWARTITWFIAPLFVLLCGAGVIAFFGRLVLK